MIGEKIKELRKSRRMTLEELARAIGTSKQTIHRYENGAINNIPPEKILALAKELGATPSELYGWDSEREFSSAQEFDGVKNNGGVIDVYGEGGAAQIRRLPILGDIACGTPIYVDEERESYVMADGVMGADFCLRAKGDSMIGARIYDGDLVFIRSQSSVDNGEIAVVVVDDEATLKRVYYYPDDEKLILSPENPRYAPMVYIGEELAGVKILGKAIGFQSRVI